MPSRVAAAPEDYETRSYDPYAQQQAPAPYSEQPDQYQGGQQFPNVPGALNAQGAKPVGQSGMGDGTGGMGGTGLVGYQPMPNVKVDEHGNVLPPGTDPALGPETTQDIVGYKPIPESMLMTQSNVAAQQNPADPALGPTESSLGTPAINWGPYTLGPDDVIHIAIRNQPEFTGVYVIGHDGKIQFGFVGDIEANGLTKEQLARRVEERLKKYVRVPQANVTIIGFNSKAIYVLGRVARPGKYAMRGDTVKLRDAVIAAGLVIRHAKLRKVHIVKSDPNDPSYRVVDLHKILYKGKMEQNADLVSGDIIVVPTTVWGGINDFLGELISPARHAGAAATVTSL
jgi:polysaccharide export outer membrane protein